MQSVLNSNPEAPESSKPKGLPATANLVPASIRRLLGQMWLVDGEDPEQYEQLLAEVAKAAQPQDVIDWLLVKDYVALTWQTQRSRRQREGIVRLARREALEKIL